MIDLDKFNLVENEHLKTKIYKSIIEINDGFTHILYSDDRTILNLATVWGTGMPEKKQEQLAELFAAAPELVRELKATRKKVIEAKKTLIYLKAYIENKHFIDPKDTEHTCFVVSETIKEIEKGRNR